jgi:tetratricopeptide (TPR) repeat protein/class 3 adenylate cyclase
VKNLIPHFIEQKVRTSENSGRFVAHTIFVDLSGFTALTNVLMQRGAAGAEEMSLVLNQIFTPTVALVYAQGGFIPYFAGDAFTAIFIENDRQTVLQTALDIRKTIQKLNSETVVFRDHNIGVKIGISHGAVEWGIVGDETKGFYFRGAAIDGCSMAQTHARKFEIVAHKDFFTINKAADWGFEPIETNFFRLNDADNFRQPEIRKPQSENQKPKAENPNPEILKYFLPDAILEFNQPGEFRQVVTVFLNFEGVDSHESLNRFAGVVLEQNANFQGYFKEIEFGDKGAVIACLFGAPVAFENNIERALEFTAAVGEDLANLESFTGSKYRLGIASGLAFCGIIGGDERCQYAAVGARVNLAARLMQRADWGEIMTDENVQRNRNFRFQAVGDDKFKGFSEKIPFFKLIGRNLSGRTSFAGALVGRREELDQLLDFAAPLRENRFAGIGYIFGEAGIGKSRLGFEFKRALRERSSVSWFTCQSDQILKKPFNPFIYFLKNYFEQSSENSADQNRERFETNLRELTESLEKSDHPEAANWQREIIRTESVLAAIVGIMLQGGLWEQLDARGRYQNGIAAVQNLFIAESILQPLVIELEDAHWFDEMSKEFLTEFLRRVRNYPIFMLATSRYDDDGSKASVFKISTINELSIPVFEIDLNILSKENLEAFVEARLGGSVHKELGDLLQKMTNGNPFYVEQMLDYFQETQLLQQKNGLFSLKKAESMQMADSVKSIMMARIDRLSGLVKETVKAAAVIGREFEIPVLREVLMQQLEFQNKNGNLTNVVKEQILSAEKWQIWQAMNELRYIFKHALLRDAAYDMQLRARLRELHQHIAEAIEKLYPKDEERLADLVFHYEQAEIDSKTTKYLEKAASFSRRNFQNRQAIRFLEKLAENLRARKSKNRKLARVLMRKGAVHELVGEWETAKIDYSEALNYAKSFHDFELTGRANRRLGQLLMLRGDYPLAKKHLEVAITCFELSSDHARTAKTQGNLGTLFFRQGQYEEAKMSFTKAIDLFDESHDRGGATPFVATLGLIFMNQGNYDAGIQTLENQLEFLETRDDKQGLTTIFTNLGIIFLEKGSLDAALQCLERGLALSEELGDKLQMTICIGCIGAVFEKKGDYERAMLNFEKDLALTLELGDKQGAAIAHGLLGDLHSILGNFDLAIEHLEKTLNLSFALGYKKGIAKAMNTLGDTYFYKNEPQKSLEFYADAIAVCRETSNKLILGYSLIEKGFVHHSLGEMREIEPILAEGKALSAELGNKDLQFGAQLLIAKMLILENKIAEAVLFLENMLTEFSTPREEAAIHFELFELLPKEEKHREIALALYRILFEETPQFLFKKRVEILFLYPEAPLR